MTTKKRERYRPTTVVDSYETPVWSAAEYWHFISRAGSIDGNKQFDKFLFYTG